MTKPGFLLAELALSLMMAVSICLLMIHLSHSATCCLRKATARLELHQYAYSCLERLMVGQKLPPHKRYTATYRITPDSLIPSFSWYYLRARSTSGESLELIGGKVYDVT